LKFVISLRRVSPLRYSILDYNKTNTARPYCCP
jgi:hypothetical protein